MRAFRVLLRVGDMVGPATAVSNAVICSPATSSIQQYDLLSYHFSGIVPAPSAGTFNMQCSQLNGITTMVRGPLDPPRSSDAHSRCCRPWTACCSTGTPFVLWHLTDVVPASEQRKPQRRPDLVNQPIPDCVGCGFVLPHMRAVPCLRL